MPHTNPKQEPSKSNHANNAAQEANGSQTDPNLTELSGFTDSNVPLEPTEPDPAQVPDDETAANSPV